MVAAQDYRGTEWLCDDYELLAGTQEEEIWPGSFYFDFRTSVEFPDMRNCNLSKFLVCYL